MPERRFRVWDGTFRPNEEYLSLLTPAERRKIKRDAAKAVKERLNETTRPKQPGLFERFPWVQQENHP